MSTAVSDFLDPSAVTVWLAEGQSSQREMLLSLQRAKIDHQLPFCIIASHRHDRPEILACADIAYREPSDVDEIDPTQKRVDFVLNHAKQHHAKVLLTGRNSRHYEARRADFTEAGIRLLTGACDVATLDMLDDKGAFIAHCHAHDIAVAEGWRFDNLEQLQTLLDKHQHTALCVKPVSGIFAQGFWRLDTDPADTWDSFEHLYFTEEKRIHTAEFIRAYRHSTMVQEKPISMLLMPYLAGREYSIDVVCERGQVLASVTRYKEGRVQHIGYDETVMALVIDLVKSINADGIISVQTKADDTGKPYVLEVNTRPSGGIGLTEHGFDNDALNLTQVAFAYWAGLIKKPDLAQFRQTLRPCAVRPYMSSVKIS